MIERLIPIQFYGMFNEETLTKAKNNWSKKGLDKLFDLRHEYYNDKAHTLICCVVINIKEKWLNWDKLNRLLKDYE